MGEWKMAALRARVIRLTRGRYAIPIPKSELGLAERLHGKEVLAIIIWEEREGS